MQVPFVTSWVWLHLDMFWAIVSCFYKITSETCHFIFVMLMYLGNVYFLSINLLRQLGIISLTSEICFSSNDIYIYAHKIYSYFLPLINSASVYPLTSFYLCLFYNPLSKVEVFLGPRVLSLALCKGQGSSINICGCVYARVIKSYFFPQT